MRTALLVICCSLLSIFHLLAEYFDPERWVADRIAGLIGIVFVVTMLLRDWQKEKKQRRNK